MFNTNLGLPNSNKLNNPFSNNNNILKPPTKMKTTYITDNGNEYPIWKAPDGTYYIIDKNGKRSDFTNPNAINIINQNIPWSISKATYTNKSSSSSKNDTPVTQTSAVSSSGGYSGGSSSTNDRYYQQQINNLQQKIEELSKPKVWTADELAELYGVKDQYDYDKILKMYNDATDQYYTDATNEQLNTNRDAERSNASYADSLLKAYLSGYNNAAPTAVGKGTLAANALSTMLGADKANEEASSNLNSIINSYKEAWDNERAQNKTTARKQYNTVGEWLLNKGANLNSADVQNYINTLNAYDTEYSGLRNAQNNLASTAAASYQNNANAALSKNQYNAANAMAKYYQAYYGNNWTKAYRNVLNDEATRTAASSSAN